MSESLNVEDWVEYLSDDQLPVLAESVQNLNDLTTSEDVRVSALTDQVLKDPNLTSRLLQISNSVTHRCPGGAVTTISRAVIWLGFTTVRDITLSMKVLDTMLEHNPSQHLLKQIALSYHTAMQASWMVNEVRHTDREEAFISALLRHVGEMAFLSRDDEVSRKLNNLIDVKGKSPYQASMEVLGCSFDDITVGLARKWCLSPMIAESFSGSESPRSAVKAILLGEELCERATLGWDHQDVQETIKKIAKFRNASTKDCQKKILDVADIARELAIHYGAAKVKHLIPGSDITVDNPLIVPDHYALEKGKAKNGGKPTSIIVDQAKQMQMMQTLSAFIQAKKFDINELFRTALDGIQSSLGLSRVGLALLSKDRKQLNARTAIGKPAEFGQVMNISMDKENLFSQAIRGAQPLWLGSSTMAGRAYLLTPDIKAKIKTNHCVVAPIIVTGKPIGVFYADAGEGNNEISDAQYSGFCMLVQQVSMVLTSVTSMRSVS